MTKAFLDTTIIVNLLPKRGEPHTRCKAALGRFNKVQFPEYALKEMKAGPLFAWIWLHNKCVVERSFERVIRGLHSMANSRRKNLPNTALEAIAETGSSRRMQMGRLVEKYGPTATEDAVHCDRMRLGLRRRITSAWSDRRSFGAELIYPISCFPNDDLRMKSGMIDCLPLSCDSKRGCDIAVLMGRQPKDVAALRTVAQSDQSRRENVKRSQVLRHILRTPNRPINDSQCRSIGDAVFALLAPEDSVVLTTNIRDHLPLADAVRKRAEEP
jgi:hypothetical protein